MMATLDIQLLQFGALIALLDKYYPSKEIEQHVLNGIRKAKKILDLSDLAAGGGDTIEVANLKAKIDIVAQTIGNLAVNIAGQIADLAINIAAQNVGIYLQPEWAAKVGVDKSFNWASLNLGEGLSASLPYTVTAGKTLYITQLSFYSHAVDVANADLNQMCMGYITDNDDAANAWYQGGNGGGGVVFSKPMAFEGGHTVNFAVMNCSNHHTKSGVTASGYEV
jgi:hypothetical protein